MTGLPLMGVFVLAIVALILMISKLRIHPFLSLLFVSLVFGLIGGVPLLDAKDADGEVITTGITASSAKDSPAPSSPSASSSSSAR